MAAKAPRIASVNLDIIRTPEGRITVWAFAMLPELLDRDGITPGRPRELAGGVSEPEGQDFPFRRASATHQSGYKTQLIPHPSPTNGIYEFDFVVDVPPDTFLIPSARTVLGFATTSSGSDPLEGIPPERVKGIRVHGAGNQVTVRVPTVSSGSPAAGDDFTVTRVVVDDDQLKVDVTYSGGCERHDFELVWSGNYLLSLPPQAVMKLVHRANGDECERLVRETLVFDLLDLAPCVIRLSTDHGYSSSVSYKLGTPGGIPVLGAGEATPGGNREVPILTLPMARFFVQMIQGGEKHVESFAAHPDKSVQEAGLSLEDIALLANDPNDGFSGSLRQLGVRDEVLQGYNGTLKTLLGNGYSGSLSVPVVRLLVQLAQDRSRLQAIKAEPGKIEKEYGLSKADVALLKGGPSNGSRALKSVGLGEDILRELATALSGP
ncbi:hypothetical protein TA3x_005664 [Tundrisphaera sp. TA3]|uniref:hypothetical protein n=1 Tax=Tundrisphaera sp. TA3 TaxID=3435775 RepID=UPI003EBA6D81